MVLELDTYFLLIIVCTQCCVSIYNLTFSSQLTCNCFKSVRQLKVFIKIYLDNY